ncbi:MAG: glutathione S-transferase [Burkholderiaceae bacterium]
MNAAGALPVLYSFRRCPYAMRARLALDAAGVRCELRETLLRDKPAELLAASPKATVPVLVLTDGLVLEQSLDIMHWALAGHDPEHWLTHAGRADAQALIDACDGPFKHHLDRYKYASRFPGEDADAHEQAALTWLHDLERRLTGRSWLLGPAASLADIALAPFIRQFAMADPARFARHPLPQLQAWLQRFVASPRFLRIMRKLPPWRPGTPGEVFPFTR